MNSVRNADDAQAAKAPAPASRAAGVLRALIGLVVAAALGLAWWSTAGTHLGGHIDYVGYPTFADFAFQRSFLTYRLLVWEFPVLSALIYVLLSWRGPLRSHAVRARRGHIAMLDAAPADTAPADPAPAESEPADSAPANSAPGNPPAQTPSVAGLVATRVVQVLPPAMLLALAVSTRSATTGDRLARTGVLAGVAYIVAVLALSALVAPLLRRRSFPNRLFGGGEAFPLVNGFAAAIVSIGSVAFVSRHTMIISGSTVRRYWPWFPAWLAVIALLAVLGWMLWRLANGWSPSRVERRIRTVLLGSVAIFLLTAAIPGAVGGFIGFDDAQSPTGADLLTRGYFPWRDFMFIHGLFEDALRSLIGFGVFQHSIWGGLAGTALIVAPLCWVGYYLQAVWAGRSGSVIGLGIFALAAWGGLPASWRFIAVPLVLILLGEALRRPKPLWTVLLTAVLFVEAVLVPETSFLVLAVLITIVAADLVHRDPGHSWWSALRRTRYLCATGALLAILLVAFLAPNHALVPFVDYFRIFGPGHDATGAIPSTGVTHVEYAMFVITTVLVALTIWMAAWRVAGRHPWSARHWVTVAAAIFAGLYGEKALGRFDGGHVLQVAAVGVPLWIMWAATAIGGADDFLVAQWLRIRASGRVPVSLRNPVSICALLLVVLLVPSVSRTVWRSPANTKQVVSSLTASPLIGYQNRGAVDGRMLADLRSVLDAYAGPNGTIFDNTNSLGYFYYLLQRTPASSFLHVSLAEPEFAQRMVIDQLAKSRPPVVVFDAEIFGLPAWDGPRNNIRHFEIAQYLLDGWTPVLRTHTVLFMLRNDLLAGMPGPPALTIQPQTTDLPFSVPACDWGEVANFLDSPPTGGALTLPVTSLGDTTRLEVRGWSFDPSTRSTPLRIVIAIGNTVVADVPVAITRPDVAAYFHDPAAEDSGYDVSIPSPATGSPRAFALGRDGALHPLGTTPTPPNGYLRMPDGTKLAVTSRAVGATDPARPTAVRVATIAVPASVDLSSFRLATFSATSAIGTARLELTDSSVLGVESGNAPSAPLVAGDRNHEIIMNVLPLAGSSIAVRVGSCLQWHGYGTRTLYLIQTGGAPITQLRLSGVRS